MLHVVNLDLMSASARHHSDGGPKDPHDHHRRAHALHRHELRRLAINAMLRQVGAALRKLGHGLRRLPGDGRRNLNAS